jgi:membrane protease YdiL (CAAX protease family)
MARAKMGLGWGVTVAAVVAGSLIAAVAIPSLHPLLDDARIAGIGPGILAYRALVRIPLGTALLKEFAFRGLLFGVWARIASPLQAAAGSSLVFRLLAHPPNDRPPRRKRAGPQLADSNDDDRDRRSAHISSGLPVLPAAPP